MYIYESVVVALVSMSPNLPQVQLYMYVRQIVCDAICKSRMTFSLKSRPEHALLWQQGGHQVVVGGDRQSNDVRTFIVADKHQ